MRVSPLIAATMIAAALTACSAPVRNEFDKEDRDTITKLVQEFGTAYNAKDAAKVAGLFSGGAGLMPPNASTVRGTEAIQTYFTGRFDQGASDLMIEARDIAGSGELAYVSGDYSLNMAPAGGPERRDRGKFLWVLRDVRDRWFLEYVIFSSDFPPAPA
jgi:uncharacterized protein (TIGR02246 family)